jgi:hypothetical protein
VGGGGFVLLSVSVARRAARLIVVVAVVCELSSRILFLFSCAIVVPLVHGKILHRKNIFL